MNAVIHPDSTAAQGPWSVPYGSYTLGTGTFPLVGRGGSIAGVDPVAAARTAHRQRCARLLDRSVQHGGRAGRKLAVSNAHS